jgi:hypothetical protein
MKGYVRSLVLSLLSCVLIPSQFAVAQSFGIGFGLPTVQIIVVNNTDDGFVMPTIGDKSGPMLVRSGRWPRIYGTYSPLGQIPIFVQVCATAEPAIHFNAPPSWTVTLEPTLALSNEYLATNPSASALKHRVEQLERFTHDQLGGKLERNELKAWFKTVKDQGISAQGFNCGSPVSVPALTFQWGALIGNGGYNMVTIVNVVGSRKTGYRLNTPQYVQ